MKNLSWKYFFLALAILLLLPGLSVRNSEPVNKHPPINNPEVLGSNETTQSDRPQRIRARVSRVIDGDTIELDTNQKLRLIGIDAPENSNGQECFNKEATGETKNLLEGKEVDLEKDVSETDRYGRLLRYVYINGQMANELLVKNGFAKVSTFPPDVKYKDLFIKAETEARIAKRGLWGDICTN